MLWSSSSDGSQWRRKESVFLFDIFICAIFLSVHRRWDHCCAVLDMGSDGRSHIYIKRNNCACIAMYQYCMGMDHIQLDMFTFSNGMTRNENKNDSFVRTTHFFFAVGLYNLDIHSSRQWYIQILHWEGQRLRCVALPSHIHFLPFHWYQLFGVDFCRYQHLSSLIGGVREALIRNVRP